MRWLLATVLGLLGCHDATPAGAGQRDRAAEPTVTPLAQGAAAHPVLAPDEGRIAIDEAPPTRPGVATEARVAVIANDGYEITEKAPVHLTLDPTPGVTLGATRVEHTGERELAFTVPLTAAAAGDYEVGGRVDFAVCKVGQQCRQKTMPVRFQVAAR